MKTTFEILNNCTFDYEFNIKLTLKQKTKEKKRVAKAIFKSFMGDLYKSMRQGYSIKLSWVIKKEVEHKKKKILKIRKRKLK